MTITAPAPSRTARTAVPSDATAIAHVLARAFEHDPVAAWFLPRQRDRLARLVRGFESVYVRRLSLPHGVVQTTGDHAGAALWIPPDKVHLSTLGELRLLPPLARVYGRGLPRALKGMAAMDEVHPHEPHYYLPIIGVDPAAQGQGIGSALLRPVLERADREGMAAYLEATTPGSRALYARHGFEDVGILHLPYDGPPLWRMWREPRS
jgi:ribosomal protein S18 acetylase RimI-like enzyme